jgi:hypothetical protein
MSNISNLIKSFLLYTPLQWRHIQLERYLAILNHDIHCIYYDIDEITTKLWFRLMPAHKRNVYFESYIKNSLLTINNTFHQKTYGQVLYTLEFHLCLERESSKYRLREYECFLLDTSTNQYINKNNAPVIKVGIRYYDSHNS